MAVQTKYTYGLNESEARESFGWGDSFDTLDECLYWRSMQDPEYMGEVYKADVDPNTVGDDDLDLSELVIEHLAQSEIQ